MYIHDATELAYKNGYKDGYEKAAKENDMTTEEKKNKLEEFCEDNGYHCGMGCALDCLKSCEFGNLNENEIDEAYYRVFPTTTIKDSGERREFETGAVRDIQEGEGRCDLMPLDVVGDILKNPTFSLVYGFTLSGEPHLLQDALVVSGVYDDVRTTFLEVAKHFEDGAKKYGEHNRQKGIPVHCYIDSAIRHYLKWLRGDNDEPHDRAFVWNILCCIWTCKHKPELNEYRGDNDEN